MRIVDSSAWIEWISGSALGQRVANELPPNDEWIVPTIVQYEVKRWGIRANASRQAESALAFSEKLILQPLDTDLAIRAAEVAAQHSLAMADAIIYATAIKYAAELLTCDAHFQNLPRVVYLAKSSP
jgi:predicted nucleic acid-binding protein